MTRSSRTSFPNDDLSVYMRAFIFSRIYKCVFQTYLRRLRLIGIPFGACRALAEPEPLCFLLCCFLPHLDNEGVCEELSCDMCYNGHPYNIYIYIFFILETKLQDLLRQWQSNLRLENLRRRTDLRIQKELLL